MRKSALLLAAAAVMTSACTTVQDVPYVPPQTPISKPPVQLNEATTLKAGNEPAPFTAAPPMPVPGNEPPAVVATPVPQAAPALARPLPAQPKASPAVKKVVKPATKKATPKPPCACK